MNDPFNALGVVARKANQKGRSAAVMRRGKAKGWKMDGAFIQEPLSLLESHAYRALNFPALKILAFLKVEHLRHGGTQNGLLLAPHAQLRRLGISPRNIRPTFDLLFAVGIVRRTSDGSRLGGREGAATYALTWLPTCDGELPTNDYLKVTALEIAVLKGDHQQERKQAQARATKRKTGQAA